MQTVLLKAICSYAEKMADDEKDLRYAPIEYVVLATLKVVKDKSLLGDQEYDRKEYEDLTSVVSSDLDNGTLAKIQKLISGKEFTDDDERKNNRFRRLASFSTVTATAAYNYCMAIIDDESASGSAPKSGGETSDRSPAKEKQDDPAMPENNSTDSGNDGNNEQEEKPVELAELVQQTSELRKQLLAKVMGQNYAVKQFVEGFFRGEMTAATDKNRKGPRSVFLFAGSPGVGKTFLAETAAAAIGRPYHRFDMSGFADENTGVEEMCGIAPNYQGTREGEVTKFVKENPKCVLLFDEIEKAHNKVIMLFLQMLDAGTLVDNKTKQTVRFDDTIIIFTTNAGKQLYNGTEQKSFAGMPKKVVLDALEKDVNPQTKEPFFPQAICSRLGTGTVVMFNKLNASDLIHITGKEFLKCQTNTNEAFDIRFAPDSKINPTILYSLGGHADARNATAAARTFFAAEIFELFRLMNVEKGPESIAALEQINWNVDMFGVPAEILSLYKDSGDARVLVFAGPEYEPLCHIDLPDGSIERTDDVARLSEMVHKDEPTIALVDYYYGVSDERRKTMNAEDIDSAGRDAFRVIREDCPDCTIYILETEKYRYNPEEMLSLTGKGAQDIVSFDVNSEEECKKQMAGLFTMVCQQRAIDTLSLRHQVLSFETFQEVSDDGKTATVSLFDLKLTDAIEAEDQKAILSAESKPNKHWDDVIIAPDVREELEYFIGYLQNPREFLSKGAKAPKGLLMYGPPGTGKTTLAKVAATESDVTFLEVSAEQFLSKWVGEGPERVHQIFATARKYAPAILFIDEIDAIGTKRSDGGGEDGSGKVAHEILNALLTEMDGFKTAVKKPVFVMAATNLGGNTKNAGALDPALVRRFDRSINIDLPNREGRIKLLKMLIKKNAKMMNISDEEIASLAVRSVGMSPANLEGAIETAIRDAIRSDGIVDDKILDEAFEKFNYGDEKKWDESELLNTARHEGGHALICSLLGEKPSYLTIVARGNHGGYMQHADNDMKGSRTRQELLNNICCALAGRAAELVYYGEEDGLTTGASNDLEQATRIASYMVRALGMYPEAGLAVMTEYTSQEQRAKLDAIVKQILEEEMEHAKQVIRDNRDKMDALVDALMEKQHLTEEEIAAICTPEA